MENFGSENMFMVRTLPWVGVACILVLGLTLVGAILSLSVLRKRAVEYLTPGDLPVHNTSFIRRLGLAAPVGIPIIFFIFWTIIIVHEMGGHS